MGKDDGNRPGAAELTRRRMLQRLGIATGLAYAAPALLGLGSARASSSGGSSSGGRASRGGGSGRSSPRPRRQRPRARRPRPEIVVAAPSPAAIDLIAAQGYGLVVRDRLGLLDAEIARFTLPQNRTIEQARTEILQLVPSALVDPNHIYRTNELACGRDGCAAFGMIGWKEAPHACPVDITIGMVDTGVNTGHEALAGTALQRVSVVDPKRRPSSRTHGTAIAVLLSGRAASRTPGLLSGARLVAVDAFHSDARGQDAADVFDIARALDRIAASKARVVNLSFAGPANLVLERVVRALVERDVVLVAAAGNSGPRADPLYPAAYPGVVAVTAVDSRLRAYRRAAAGEHIDFAAPGVRVWAAASVRGGRFRSGTSYAAPFVSAALAAVRAADPQATSREIVDRLAAGAMDLGRSGRDTTFGWGLVQAPAVCAMPPADILPAVEAQP